MLKYFVINVEGMSFNKVEVIVKKKNTGKAFFLDSSSSKLQPSTRLKKMRRSTSPLSHLSSLAPQASHALLAPLGAHATVDTHEQGHGIRLTDDSVEGARSEGCGAVNEALEAFSDAGEDGEKRDK